MRRRNPIAYPLALLALVLAAPAWAGGFSGGVHEAFGLRYDSTAPRREAPRRPRHDFAATSWIRHWNEIAVDASGLDHTPVAPGESRVFGEQLGPGRASRAMAIVHIAVFEAVNAIAGRYQSYTGIPHADAGTSAKAAIAQAAHDTLVALFPSQAPSFDERLAEDLRRVRDRRAEAQGVDLGRRAAAAILALRADDGSQRAEPRIGVDFIPSSEAGQWRQDPISRIPLALGAHWGEVLPFVLASADQSGHAGFGGALFETLRSFYGTDAIAFTFVSDEFNGVTRDNGGQVRPLVPRSFSSLAQAEEENGQSRIYLGIHWAFDKTEGIALGRRVADYVFANAFLPRHRSVR